MNTVETEFIPARSAAALSVRSRTTDLVTGQKWIFDDGQPISNSEVIAGRPYILRSKFTYLGDIQGKILEKTLHIMDYTTEEVIVCNTVIYNYQ